MTTQSNVLANTRREAEAKARAAAAVKMQAMIRGKQARADVDAMRKEADKAAAAAEKAAAEAERAALEAERAATEITVTVRTVNERPTQKSDFIIDECYSETVFNNRDDDA